MSALICASLWWAELALAQASTRQYDIDIGPIPLSQALQLFSDQTKLQHGYIPTDDAEEQLIVKPLKGRYTADEALQKLLPDGFTFTWVNPRTISIIAPQVNAPPGGVSEVVAGKDEQRSELSKEQRLAMANGDRSGSARDPYDSEVIVEGQRIFDSLFDSLDLDLPTTVFDREAIDSSGASSVTDLFRYVTQHPNAKPETYLDDGTQFADLRGLGFDSTLVLINGRRVTPSASALLSNAFDLNNIPLAAIDRIEITSESTSAIYGADAIGGVVNIVLRDAIPEPRLDIDYGAADGGAVERHAAFAASAKRSRARGSIVLDYFDRGPLLGRERDRWSNQDFTRFDSIDWRLPAASPGNVSSTTLENLPGLSSRFAAIPSFSSGSMPVVDDFVSTAGQRNLESWFRYYTVNYSGTRRGASAQAEYDLAPQLRAYGELLYVDRELTRRFEPPAIMNGLLSANNPHNPFATEVIVDTLLTDLEPRTFTRRNEMLRAVGGIRGKFGNWNWEGTLQSSQDEATTVNAGGLNFARTAAALVASDPEVALNPFGGRGANSSTLLRSLLDDPTRNRFRTDGTQSVALLRGPLVSLGTGVLELVAGGEWREERIRYELTTPLALVGSHQRSVTSAFGELRVPLIGEESRHDAAQSLAVVLSGRMDEYSDIGHTFNPEYALLWRPTSSLHMRASFAQSFRPPPLSNLHLPAVDATGFIVDEARNGELAQLIWRAGGNSELKPSTADSLSFNFSFEPAGLSGLRVGANYWRIAIDDTIAIPSAERLLAAESLFPQRVIRGPRSAADLAAGMPGPLQLIDIRRINFGSLRTSGVDASVTANLHTRAGKIKPQVAVTWVRDFATSDLVEGADVQRAGIANVQGTIPRWRSVASLSWSRGGIGASSTLRYVPSYKDVDFSGDRNGRRVASQTILDAQLSLDLGSVIGPRSAWNGFEVRLGAFNLLNSEPPFAEVGALVGFDATQADLQQRFAYLKIAKSF